jgi:hypothetical protein
MYSQDNFFNLRIFVQIKVSIYLKKNTIGKLNTDSKITGFSFQTNETLFTVGANPYYGLTLYIDLESN